MKKINYVLITLFFLVINASIYSQESSPMYAHVKTLNGDTYTGKIIEKTDTQLKLISLSDVEITIQTKDIKRIKEFPFSQLRNGVYWFENPNATRNVYGPTAYGLRKGEGYYQNFMIFLNSVSYGFTDNFTIGAGLVPVTFGEGLMFTITPKFSFPIVKDKFNVGAGVLYAHLFEEHAGIAYGVATYGSRENNITIGTGYGLIEGEWAKAPMLTFSGMTRLGRKFALVTENWMIPYQERDYYYDPITYESTLISEKTKYNVLFSYGMRFMTEQITFDLAFVNSADIADGLSFGIPLLGLVVPFGDR